MKITVNAVERAAPDGATLADLAAELGLAERGVAIERNLEVAPRSQWAATPLADGDRIEIVQFVGGGL
jgi:sulfur carrier protein